jgi:PAS domain S-box-containing protein
MNPVAEALTGWKQLDALGREATEVFNITLQETRTLIESPVAQTLQSGIAIGILKQTMLIARNGDEIPIDHSVAPIKDDLGNIIGVVLVFQDITERQRAEADIRNALEKEKELNELKSRFVAMTSHEFRTPLATILSSAELLEHYSHKWGEEKRLNHLQRIQVAVKHITELLNDVLLIGKAEAGKLEFKPTSLELVQFCHTLVEEMQLPASNHTITFRTQDQCLNACMDEKLLRHILGNLLSNAIKYSPQGSTINFELTSQQGEVIFHIQDRGIGIPASEQAQLFNSFYRASNVGTISGTGLGLAIVKKSVDLHGGEISVASAVGVGTTFKVTLPLNNIS